MPTLAEAKAQALAIASSLRLHAAQLRLLEPPIVGLTAQASAIEASASAIEAAANAATEPPVIVLSRTTITPDDVPGANDQEKVVNAHAEAVSRGRPMRWNRRYVVRNITLTEAHDGIEIVADADCGPVLSSEIVNPQGLLYHMLPAGGKSLEVSMRGVSMLGNRANTPDLPRQNAITLGNPGAGTVRLIIDDTRIQEFEHAGIMVWGDGCEVVGTNVVAFDCGDAGFGTTRGRMMLTGCEAARCAVGFNASAGDFNEFVNCFSHHNAAGAKISLRSGETDASGAAFKARLHLVNMRIEDNLGTGLSSTSAAAGSVISGSVSFARNAGGAINLTDATEGRFAAVVSVDDGNHADDDAAAILLSGAGKHRFASLTIQRAKWRGVNGGWGRDLSIGRLSIDGCAGPGLRWVHAPIQYDNYVPGVNGGPDELVNNV